MKILLINKYLYPKGGDAISTILTGKLLSEKGHEVYYWGMKHPENPEYAYKKYFVPYIDYNKLSGLLKKIKASLNILYSFNAKKRLKIMLKKVKPDIIHLNNFAHQISPSILDVINRYNIPVVMTMHDYKLVCPSYSMISNKKPCESCKGGRYYYCLLKRCKNSSLLKSFINTLEMYLHHKILRIYHKIDIFISPSIFLMNKVKEMGLKGTMFHLPNFIDFKSLIPAYISEEDSIVYVGRLSYEKGLETLLNAVKDIDIKLKIIGDGPLKEKLDKKVKHESAGKVIFLGFLKQEKLIREIKKSFFTVLPSECYENNPYTVIESFALGKPVLGSRIGGIPELCKDNITGLTFEAGNVKDLHSKIEYLLMNHKKINQMGKNARKFLEKELNSEKHYEQLMNIYKKALEKHRF